MYAGKARVVVSMSTSSTRASTNMVALSQRIATHTILVDKMKAPIC